jgi:hypothetical protein
MQQHDRIDTATAEHRLERSIASVLRIIDAAQVERQAPSVRAARGRIGQIYGATRLARARERLAAS